jgi:hypothetical protein
MQDLRKLLLQTLPVVLWWGLSTLFVDVLRKF